MSKARLEAFSDGVIAIIITITVLLIDLPEGNDFSSLIQMMPIIISYFVSFVIVGVHWVNHHHLFQIAGKVGGRMLWSNLIYLFVLSFIPVSTGWVGRSNFAVIPVRTYVVVNLMLACCYILLEKAVLHSQNSKIVQEAFDEKRKEVWVICFELLSLGATFLSKVHYIAIALLIVALAPWFVPDRRSKRAIEKTRESQL